MNNTGFAARLLGFAAFTLIGSGAQAAVSLTSAAYTQNFDTLASIGTTSAAQPGGLLPFGWRFAEAGGNADTSYRIGSGTATDGDTYSFGAAGSTERALGGVLSGSNTPLFGAVFTNNIGSSITGLAINYTGEFWRRGDDARTDRLDFQYRIGGADDLNSGTWLDLNALDFTSPAGTAIGALNGNANTQALAGALSSLNIGSGQTFAIRWSDFNTPGADDGLGVDNFALTATLASTPAVPEPATWAMMIGGFGLIGGAMRRRTATAVLA